MNGQYIALHGGVSARMESIEDINTIDRNQEPGIEENLFNDLLWADPLRSRLASSVDEIDNEDRGISVKFGLPVLRPLLEKANLKTLIRAHQ